MNTLSKLLFGVKKVKCFSCQRKVKDDNLATIKINCVDGILERKLCKDCEKIFEKNT